MFRLLVPSSTLSLHAESPPRLPPIPRPQLPRPVAFPSQALYALLQPSYPEDLLPLTFKPWDPQQQQQQRQGQPGSDGSGDVAALTAAAGAGPAGGANASSSPPPPPGGWWQVVAAGDFPQRLLPVLCDCVPLLAEVVDRVMVQGQGAGQGAEGGDGMDAGRQPRSAVYGGRCVVHDARPALRRTLLVFVAEIDADRAA